MNVWPGHYLGKDIDRIRIFSSDSNLGDICIQNFHLGRYIVRYTVRNLVLRQRASGAVKRDFQKYIQRYTSPNENFEYGYPHSNALLQFDLKLEWCRPHKATCHPRKGDVIDDVKLFPTVYSRIYSRKILTLSNQTSGYKRKCIRMCFLLYNSQLLWWYSSADTGIDQGNIY